MATITMVLSQLRWLHTCTYNRSDSDTTTIIPEELGTNAESSGLRSRPEGAQRLKAGPEGPMVPRSCRGLKV